MQSLMDFVPGSVQQAHEALQHPTPGFSCAPRVAAEGSNDYWLALLAQQPRALLQWAYVVCG